MWWAFGKEVVKILALVAGKGREEILEDRESSLFSVSISVFTRSITQPADEVGFGLGVGDHCDRTLHQDLIEAARLVPRGW